MTNRLLRNGELVAKGQNAESAALHWLKSAYPGAKIDDMRDNPIFQQKEIDFRVYLPSRVELFEVKYDKHIARTGNAVFELCRIHHTSLIACAYVGWGVFTESNRVLVWNFPTLTFYDFKTADLRAGMQRYVNETRQNANIRPVYSDNLRTTVNVYVPLRYVPHERHKWTGRFWSTLAKDKAA